MVAGATDGMEISAGLTSGNKALGAAGADIFSFRFDTWYKKLDDEVACRHERTDVPGWHG